MSEIEKEVIDNYLEHEFHLVSDSNCSECHKNPPVVKLNEDGYIVLDEDSELSDEDLYCKYCGTNGVETFCRCSEALPEE